MIFELPHMMQLTAPVSGPLAKAEFMQASLAAQLPMLDHGLPTQLLCQLAPDIAEMISELVCRGFHWIFL
jgi:hypothetical protein